MKKQWQFERAKRGLARRARKMRGASALEFVIVLPFFLLVVVFILELGIAFVTQEMLDNAARDAARQLRIGSISGSGYASSIISTICNDLTFSNFTLIPSCTQKIQLYVAAAPSGSPAGAGFKTLKTAVVSGTTMAQTQSAVSANYDVLLQVGYAYPWFLPAFKFATGSSLLIATIAFQTEPY